MSRATAWGDLASVSKTISASARYSGSRSCISVSKTSRGSLLVFKSGRFLLERVRSTNISTVACRYITRPLWRIALRTSSRVTAPPPVASTIFFCCTSSKIICASRSRNPPSPSISKIVLILTPVRSSIRASESIKSMPRLFANARPTVVLPTPMGPSR